MRISDWSSDVCSSDLEMGRRALLARDRRARHGTDGPRGGVRRCPRLSPAAGPRPLCDLWTETGMSGSDKTAARRILPESRLDDLGEAIIALTREIWVLTDSQAVLVAVLAEHGLDMPKPNRYTPNPALPAEFDVRPYRVINKFRGGR